MNNAAFISYTPRIVRFDYDILESTIGCQLVPGGTRVSDVFPFLTVCVDYHNSASPFFTQPETVSYFTGPKTPGSSSMPFRTGWAYWVGANGMRVGQYSKIVPPANTLGLVSGLYPETKSTHVSAAFNKDGLLAVAIHIPTGIELKRYLDEDDSTATVTWQGLQPLLWFTGEFYRTETYRGQVVCFYLREESLKNVYVRLEEDAFATEYLLNSDLTVSLTTLLRARAVNGALWVYARDINDRDVILKTDRIAMEFSEASSMTAAFQTGLLFEAGKPTEDIFDKSNLACTLISGLAHKSVIDGGDLLDTDKSTLSAIILDGEVL